MVVADAPVFWNFPPQQIWHIPHAINYYSQFDWFQQEQEFHRPPKGWFTVRLYLKYKVEVSFSEGLIYVRHCAKYFHAFFIQLSNSPMIPIFHLPFIGRGNWGLEFNLFALNQPTETKLFSANTSYSYWGSERFFPVTSLDLSWNSVKHARGRSLVYGASVLLTQPCLAQMEHYVDRIISTGVSTWHQDVLQCQRVPGSSQPPT